jgi:hypothetical protein
MPHGRSGTEDDRFLDAGNDRVVHLYRLVMLGGGSGIEVRRDVAAVWQIRNGKLVKGQGS